MDVSCTNPTHDCYENNATSPSYCPTRDACEVYDIRKDHARLDSMFWSFIETHQEITFKTSRGLPFTYQVIDSNGREMLVISRDKNLYTKNAVLGSLGREVGEEYYGRTYIAPLVDRFLSELRVK